MTVPATARRAGPLLGNGVTTSFPFSFRIFQETDIRVVKTLAGVDTNFVLNSDYTVAVNVDQANNPGGFIVPTVVAAVGVSFVIIGDIGYDQSIDLPDGGAYRAEQVEDGLDKLSIQIQQVKEQADRALVYAESTGAGFGTLPDVAARANKFLAFGADGVVVMAAGTGADSGLRADLAGASGDALIGVDGGTLASFFKSKNTRVVANIAALRNINKTKFEIVHVRCHTVSEIGSGTYYYDSTDVVSTDNNGTLIVAADGGRWRLAHNGRVSVTNFGAVGNDSTNNDTAFANARAWLAALTTKVILVFPAGIYLYSVSPNWAIQNVEIHAEGEVRLRYTGVGNAVIFDAGATAPDLCYNVTFGGANRFHIDAPATAGHGVYARSVHHSKIRANVHGCGAAFAGLFVEFAVVTEFDVVVSGNEGGWYLGAMPNVGYLLDERLAGETTSYCLFPNPIVEGVPVGIELVNTLGNIFMGGTSEGCSIYGVLAGVGSLNDKFIGTDFEVNTVADVFCNGLGITFQDCDSYSLMAFGANARRCNVRGGQHQTIDIQAGATATTARDLIYNRFTSTGTFTDSGTRTVLDNVRDASNELFLAVNFAYDPPSIAGGAVATQAVTIPGAKLGDSVTVSFSLATTGLVVTAAIVAANTASVTLQNITGAPVDIAAGTLRLVARRIS